MKQEIERTTVRVMQTFNVGKYATVLFVFCFSFSVFSAYGKDMTCGASCYSFSELLTAKNDTTNAGYGKGAMVSLSLMETVFIPNGTFVMGSTDGSENAGMNPPPGEPTRNKDETQHLVTLTKDFYMSRYQVTNAQYAAFLNANNIDDGGEGQVTYYDEKGNLQTGVTELFIESHPWGVTYNELDWVAQSGYEDHPVIYVTWYGAKAYADWLGGALPTEAQWEYACRGGYPGKATEATKPFGLGEGTKLTSEMANFYWNYSYVLPDGEYEDSTSDYPGETQPVGSYLPNSYGLYDMHGNVWEWCSDWYRNYGSDPLIDPDTQNHSGAIRVLRGGAWSSDAQDCRSAHRSGYNPDFGNDKTGFRVVFVP